MLMEKSQIKLKLLLKRLREVAQKLGLHMNKQKTEYMVIGRRECSSIKVDQFEFRRVGHFKHLTTILSGKNYITK